MTDAILTLNAGSSSVKFALFRISDPSRLICSVHGQIEGIGIKPHFVAKDIRGVLLADQKWPDGPTKSHEALLQWLLEWIESHLGADKLVAVGHRVVHGGPDYDQPARTTDKVLRALDRLTLLAPLHQPHNLSPIRAITAIRPTLPQIACFDTAFHRTMPNVATRFALPREYDASGLRRYGFHGLSYEYIAQRLRAIAPDLAKKRVIAAHLGNGASLCAMLDGRSIDTTMGFTALDGLMMGTRCGTIDPGAVLYLQEAHSLTPKQVEDVLYHRSGLLGVSGISSDMRLLLDNPDNHAREAVELFVFRIAREVGALASSLGGIDALVFSAGIGEHAPAIRAAVCQRLEWLGATLDEKANKNSADRISVAGSRLEVRVLPTDEEAMIAQHTFETVFGRTTEQ